MIKIEDTHVDNIVRAVYSARNAMNSWEKSDSDWETDILGENDLALAKKLSKAGSDHGKFLRMINVTVDITAPLYWWKEFDTYKVGTVANSCSTMHKIAEKEFTLEDFSCEHLIDDINECWNENIEAGTECRSTPLNILEDVVFALNQYRDKYLLAKTKPMKEESKRAGLVKKFWWQMIQLLPSSYNQKRTVQMNYQVLKQMYFARRNHRLDEWHTLCDWIEDLPYFREVVIQDD